MRVACPNCAAEYDLPPAVVSRLGGGRTVRCTRCAAAWAPEPPAPPPPASAAAAPAAPAPPPIEVPPSPPPGPRPNPPAAPGPAVAGAREEARVLLLWVLSVLLLAGAAWAAWHWQVEIVAAWPAAARAYIALGAGR